MHTLSKNTLFLAIALAALAGCVDAIGFMQLNGFFVSFMSGNSTRLAISLQRGDWPAVCLLLSIVCCFIAGTILGSLIRSHAPFRNKALGVLLAVSSLLAAAALCDNLGAATAAMLLIALAMGSENDVLQSNNQNIVGVTYMTGTLVKMGQYIAIALRGGDKFSWLPYLALWAGLMAGGVTGAFLFLHYGANALWFPALWSWLLTGVSWTNWSHRPDIR